MRYKAKKERNRETLSRKNGTSLFILSTADGKKVCRVEEKATNQQPQSLHNNMN